MNNWGFTGRLGKDAEQRFTPSGDAVTSFSVGVTSGYGDKAKTSWANCTLWGKQATGLYPYLKKGTQVAINGELELREYQSKDGTTGKSLEVRVSSLTLIGSKGDNDTSSSKENAPQAQSSGMSEQEFEDSIPF